MGLRDRLEKSANKFGPRNLTDSNVQAIFNRVLALLHTKVKRLHLSALQEAAKQA